MPKQRKSLTVEELKTILVARSKVERCNQARLKARIEQELGIPMTESQPAFVLSLVDRLTSLICELIASRLVLDERTVPLFSSADIVQLTQVMVDEIVENSGDEFDDEDRTMLEMYVKATFEATLETVFAVVSPRKDPYQEYWKWMNVVFDLAAERGVQPAEFLALDGSVDEITRQLFSKSEFIALFRRAQERLEDAKIWKDHIIKPILALYPDEDLAELERELEVELMPKVREVIEKSVAVSVKWFDEEAERIYT